MCSASPGAPRAPSDAPSHVQSFCESSCHRSSYCARCRRVQPEHWHTAGEDSIRPCCMSLFTRVNADVAFVAVRNVSTFKQKDRS